MPFVTITLNPSVVIGGTLSVGTVLLSAPAPPGGAVIALWGSSKNVVIPNSVTIPEGQTQATFTIDTSAVTTLETVDISGVYNGGSASLTLKPPPPSIEGFGKNTTGGIGGALYTVTNLNDSGPGSLRTGLLQAGPRIIKFAVAGTITLAAHIEVLNGNLTIDGSDAPNGGICVKGNSIFIRASNVIIQHVRFRIGPTPDSSLTRGDRDNVSLIAQAGTTMSNVVIDHCSFSWADDGNLDIVDGVRDVTVQWCIFSENFGPGHMLLGSGGICSGKGGSGITIHHCLFVQGGRNPEITCGDIDFVNNVIFRDYDGRNHYAVGQPLYFAALSYTASYNSPFARVNWVGNYYKPGTKEVTGLGKQQIRTNGDSGKCGGVDSAYVEGNIGPSRPSDTLPQSAILYDNSGGTSKVVTTRFPFPQVTTTSAVQALTDVLKDAGATLPTRDAVDTRIVGVVTSGISGPTTLTPWSQESDPATVGGWPDLTRP